MQPLLLRQVCVNWHIDNFDIEIFSTRIQIHAFIVLHSLGLIDCSREPIDIVQNLLIHSRTPWQHLHLYRSTMQHCVILNKNITSFISIFQFNLVPQFISIIGNLPDPLVVTILILLFLHIGTSKTEITLRTVSVWQEGRGIAAWLVVTWYLIHR